MVQKGRHAKGLSPEFRRRVLHLLKAGGTVAQVAADLQISDQVVYNWRRQERIGNGLIPGVTSAGNRKPANADGGTAAGRP